MREVPREYRRRAERELEGLSARDLATILRAGASVDLEGPLSRLDVPTLVLCGERDRLNLPLSQHLASALPRARFEVVPGAGHVANVESADAFNAALTRFLGGPGEL